MTRCASALVSQGKANNSLQIRILTPPALSKIRQSLHFWTSLFVVEGVTRGYLMGASGPGGDSRISLSYRSDPPPVERVR